MSAQWSLLNDLSEDAVWRLEAVCCRFEQSWQAGTRPQPEDFLADVEGVERLAVMRELLRLDGHYRRQAGELPVAGDYAPRFPDATAVLRDVFPVVFEEGNRSPAPSGQSTTYNAERTGPHLGAMNSGPAESSAVEEERSGQPAHPPAASRFRVLRSHAEGGLGEVFVAEDVELHREVALKEIKRTHTGHEDSRVRFVQEAEITGNLEHPGIVPVYGMGRYPDGRPYYAMRFIRGQTLAAAIEDFHRQTPARFDSLEFRNLLGRLVAVCQAVAYAHSRGVLHRDIKPGNIMLGKFGETLLVDWGLAKVVGRTEARPADAGAEGTLRPLTKAAQATDGAVGTPAYMSPEQAAGKVNELGPATDVYSLGATLYTLLTNRAPFTGPVVEVVKQVQRGTWVRPRQLNGAVPAALDAICRKAMALWPEERYGSAQALAEDVEHWLGDGPVAAYAEPAGARLRRWLRERPRRVTAAVVLLIAAVVGLAAGTVLLERKNREAQENLAIAEGQANFVVQAVSEDLLLNEPGMQELRYVILLKVLKDYEDILQKHPGDPHARQQMAEAKRQMGELYFQAGEMTEADSYAVGAVKLYEGLLRDVRPGQDLDLRFGLARACYVVADLRLQADALGEGRTAADRSIELLERLRDEEPGNGHYLVALARSYDLRATALGQEGDLEAGLADNHRALEILVEKAPGFLLHGQNDYRAWREQRLFYHPGVASYHIQHMTTGTWSDMKWPELLLLGRVCTDRGVLLGMAGRSGEAAPVLEQAITAHRRLLDQSPRASPFRHGLALALIHAGRLKVQLGLPGRAEANLWEALRLMRHLVEDDPLVKEYQVSRVLAAGYLGEALFRQGRTATAAELLREAAREGEDILCGPGTNHRLHIHYARLLHVLGCLETECGDPDRGLVACHRAQEKLEQALRETAADRSLRSDCLDNREALARQRFLNRAPTRDLWIAEQRAILQARKDLLAVGASPRFQGKVAATAAVLAGLLLDADRPAEALSCVEGVLPAHEKAARAEKERRQAAAKDRREGLQLPATPQQAQSLRLFMRDAPIVPDTALDSQWARLLARRASALTRLARDAEAEQAVRQAVGLAAGMLSGGCPLVLVPSSPGSLWASLPTLLWPQESCHLYDLSCHLALASTLPGEKGQPDRAAEAVRLLGCAVAAGFDNVPRVRTDPDLAPLRKRDDFQRLVQKLNAKKPSR